MLYTANVDAIAAVSLKKATAMKHSLTGFLTLSVMAGFYIGFGVILAFIAAAPVAALNPGIGKIVAGATFGIALSLVIVGGAELFTGYNLLIFKGTLRGTITLGDSMLGWFWTYLGNLGGSMLFALMVIALVSLLPIRGSHSYLRWPPINLLRHGGNYSSGVSSVTGWYVLQYGQPSGARAIPAN